MKFLSVRAPWAQAIVSGDSPLGPKTIENRSWATSERDPIGIHVSQKPDPDGLAFYVDADLPIPTDLDLGNVIGSVRVAECHVAGSIACETAGCRDNPWAFFAEDGARIVHWMLADPRRLVTPFRARGALMLWEGTDRESDLTRTGETWPSR